MGIATLGTSAGDFHTESLFTVPLYIARIDDCSELNRRLVEEFERSKPEHQFSHAAQGRYENTLVRLELAPTVDLVLQAAERIGARIVERSVLVNRDPSDLGFWFNSMEEEGSETLVHNHAGGAVLSGVYYVRAPKGSGSIRFTRERSHYFEPSLNHWVNEGRFYEDRLLEPEEGMMVLFPAFVDHAVTPNVSGKPRLSLAFNLSARE
jgi:putative 2-oxoglutarate-Fe(II)-dependent oxygenase superfamily protein